MVRLLHRLRILLLVWHTIGLMRAAPPVNEWLIHHMDEAPFHKLCYKPSISTKQINDYLNEYGTDSALVIDTIHGMTPIHMLAMNPHASTDSIAALLDSNMEAFFCLDHQQKTTIEYSRGKRLKCWWFGRAFAITEIHH
eukprot:140736_1